MIFQYLRNKRCFSHRGVIFELESQEERNAIVMCHWPHCGMSADTAKKLANWLLKRAEDLENRKPTPQAEEELK